MGVRRWLRAIHRDIGYLCVGMTLIYAISGVAINHLNDWDPNYSTNSKELIVNKPLSTKADIIKLLESHGEKSSYTKHYFSGNRLVILVKGGSAIIDINQGKGLLTRKSKRSFFNEINFLHYNIPKDWWTWFSDLYALALITLALTGLFVIRGRKGIAGRGAILTILGILLPILFLYFYY